MPLTADDIQRLAELSRISITDTETVEIQTKLNRFFSLIKKMQDVDTDGVEPMSHPQDIPLRLREDVVTEPDYREAVLPLSAQYQDSLFLVPKVIDSD